MRSSYLVALAGLAAGCTGIIGGDPSVTLTDAQAAEVNTTGLRRLTRVEMDQSIRDVLGDGTRRSARLLAPEPTDPYDNDYRLQIASGALIESIETLAVELSDAAMMDPVQRAALLPCNPTGPNDAACLRAFVQSLGRKMFRRPLADDEVERFMVFQPFSVEANDFDYGAKLVIRAMVQEPAFLYRVELGNPTTQTGVFKLTSYELAARMSYFLVGSTPPDWLLDEAANGGLDTKDGVTSAARRLIGTPNAHDQIERYHALWLGYHRLPHALDLTTSMQAESDALVNRVVFGTNGDYFDLFTATDSYLDARLAGHYGVTGFTGGTGFAWTQYGATPRKGLLSHGSVLSQGVKFADSSPTQRGLFIRNRLLCGEIGPPPPGVNADAEPVGTTSPCKKSRYQVHASGGCANCHNQVDPIGFGLERFDREGRYRTTDDGLPQCAIDGQGEVFGSPAGNLTFNGPDGLADALIASGAFERCVVTQVFRFREGRREGADDVPGILARTEEFKGKQRNFQELLVDMVSDEAFGFRRDEEVP
ncbi:MAG: DUF1588 domain-containing protein [Archangium sp.]|nr:DUF1588 domain-containing protein [Archangium sp.]